MSRGRDALIRFLWEWGPGDPPAVLTPDDIQDDYLDALIARTGTQRDREDDPTRFWPHAHPRSMVRRAGD
jgi:hypothetical protein